MLECKAKFVKTLKETENLIYLQVYGLLRFAEWGFPYVFFYSGTDITK